MNEPTEPTEPTAVELKRDHALVETLVDILARIRKNSGSRRAVLDAGDLAALIESFRSGAQDSDVELEIGTVKGPFPSQFPVPNRTREIM